MSKKRLAVTAAVLLVALATVQLLLDPGSWMASAIAARSTRIALAAARERWRSHDISDYSIDVEGFVPLVCLVHATLTVQDDALVAVESWGLPGAETQEAASVPPEQWDRPYCSLSALTVPEMFARVEEALDNVDVSRDRVTVRFDPDYGYVTEYRYTCCHRLGILNPRCADCSPWFILGNLRPNTG